MTSIVYIMCLSASISWFTVMTSLLALSANISWFSHHIIMTSMFTVMWMGIKSDYIIDLFTALIGPIKQALGSIPTVFLRPHVTITLMWHIWKCTWCPKCLIFHIIWTLLCSPCSLREMWSSCALIHVARAWGSGRERWKESEDRDPMVSTPRLGRGFGTLDPKKGTVHIRDSNHTHLFC